MKKYSISQKLFCSYVVVFIVSVLVLIGGSVWYTMSVIEQNLEKTQRQLMSSMDENIVNYFSEMNDFSKELLNSFIFKKTALVDLPEAHEEKQRTVELFSDMYKEAYKMFQKKYQVGVVLDEGYYIWMGSRYFIAPVNTKQIHTYDTLQRDETPHIYYVPENEYLKATGADRSEPSIVLARSMDWNQRYLNGRAILEVQVSEAELQRAISSVWKNRDNNNIKVNIFDREGNPLYRESDVDVKDLLDEVTLKPQYKDENLIYTHRIYDGV